MRKKIGTNKNVSFSLPISCVGWPLKNLSKKLVQFQKTKISVNDGNLDPPMLLHYFWKAILSIGRRQKK